jgi:hypothetical protein
VASRTCTAEQDVRATATPEQCVELIVKTVLKSADYSSVVQTTE